MGNPNQEEIFVQPVAEAVVFDEGKLNKNSLMPQIKVRFNFK